jgi:hypothetical protein
MLNSLVLFDLSDWKTGCICFFVVVMLVIDSSETIVCSLLSKHLLSLLVRKCLKRSLYVYDM